MSNVAILLTVCGMMSVSQCPELPNIVVKPVDYVSAPNRIMAFYSNGTVGWYQDVPDSIKAHEFCHYLGGDETTCREIEHDWQ